MNRTTEKGGQVKQLLAISILVFIFVGNAYAPDVQKFKVGVSVKCDNKTTKGLIESNIKRELQQLQDVAIINPEKELANYILLPFFVDHRDKLGRKNGDISISTQSLESVFLYRRLKPHLSRDKLKELFIDSGKFPVYFQKYISTYLITGNITDLANHCRMIVDDFDTNVLEKTRGKM